jgi:hypothetical protein
MRESQLEKNEFDNDSGEFATKKNSTRDGNLTVTTEK